MPWEYGITGSNPVSPTTMFTLTENPNILEILIDSGDKRQQECLEVLKEFNLRIFIERDGSYEGLTCLAKK